MHLEGRVYSVACRLGTDKRWKRESRKKIDHYLEHQAEESEDCSLEPGGTEYGLILGC